MDKLSLIISKIRRNHWYRTYMRPIYLFVYGNRKLKNRNRIFLQYSQELLTNFHQAMNEVGIPYWLEFGTLLGAVREHSFISHDFDLDVGLFKEDYSDIIREVLKKIWFQKNKVYNRP
ncbi:LicD family protein [Bacteroides thetaiotaomicron]|uniref:LicD family protein n=1 Tax=Bacteroides thetaiotaomicron TaxID=818 RepID=UPI00286E16DD|nr:LicD family protein [Bacteroides thetaiotaomicron]MCS2220388.1 LicD family protein [Bacteroides thetaiotaomicron]